MPDRASRSGIGWFFPKTGDLGLQANPEFPEPRFIARAHFVRARSRRTFVSRIPITRHHAPGMPLRGAVRKEQFRVTLRAAAQRPESIAGRKPRSQQLPAVRLNQIQMKAGADGRVPRRALRQETAWDTFSLTGSVR